MNIYVDLIQKLAVNSPTDPTPAVRPDLTAPATYPINLYFLRSNGAGGYTYVRFQNAVIQLNLRSKTIVEIARFSLTFRGAETAQMDTTFNPSQIQTLLQALPTIGIGNVSVTKDNRSVNDPRSFTVQFIGALAGIVPAMTVRIVSSTPAAEGSVDMTTDVRGNPVQVIRIKRVPLASITTWTETGVGSGTPGWSGTLDTTAVSVGEWDDPAGDLTLQVTIGAVNARAGTDGVTLADGVGRSGTDGQAVATPSIIGTANLSDNGNDSFMVGADVKGIYGRKFRQADIGASVTDVDGYVFPGTTILEVIDDGITNAARLSQRFTQFGMTMGASMTYTLAGIPSVVFYSPTASWTQADVGHVVTGSSIPAGTRITAIITSAYVRLSQDCTALGVVAWNIVGDQQNIFQSATAIFQTADIGSKIRAPGVFTGDATITGWISPTQVTVDQRPNAAGTAITWQVIPARAYPTPVVTRLTTGTVSNPEVQKIALTQAAVGGQLTIQDGYGSGMPVVTLNNPVSTGDLQNKLNGAYINYGSCQVTQVIPGIEWNINFGAKGGQRLLLVNDAQAVYEKFVLDWIVMDGVGVPAITLSGQRVEWPNGSPPVIQRNGINYIGFTTPYDVHAVGQPRYGRETDGTGAMNIRQKYMAFADAFNPPPIGTGIGGGFYLSALEGGEERNGLYTVDYVGHQMPNPRRETHQQQRAIIVPQRVTTNGFLTDIQLTSVTISTYMWVYFTYWLEGQSDTETPDGNAAAVVHFTNPQGTLNLAVLEHWNNFDTQVGTWGRQWWIGWSRRWWRGAIWEQRSNYN